MKSGSRDFTSRLEPKGSASKLKILSRKTGLAENGSPQPNQARIEYELKIPKNFRIGQSKQLNQSKLADSKYQIASRKNLYRGDQQTDKNQSSSNIGFAGMNSQRRPSGFNNYMIGSSSRR